MDTKKLKVLIGGAPFGVDPFWDEATLRLVIETVLEANPSAKVTIATHHQSTISEKLGVDCLPLYVSRDPAMAIGELAGELQSHDVFIWTGAASYYYDARIPITMLELAQKAYRKTILWNVGINGHLSYLVSDRKNSNNRGLKTLLRHLNFLGNRKRKREIQQSQQRIAAALEKTDLIVVQDSKSREEFRRCGVQGEIMLGADVSLDLQPTPIETLPLSAEETSILHSPRHKIGFCISPADKLSFQRLLINFLDDLIDLEQAKLVFLPCRPNTDIEPLQTLSEQLAHKQEAAVMTCCHSANDILAILSKMNLVITNQPSLLMLSCHQHIPIVGIEYGIGLSHHVKSYGLTAIPGINPNQFESLRSEIRRLLSSRKQFENISQDVLKRRLKRLKKSKKRLTHLLN